MIYSHVNTRVESVGVNLNLWFCTCVLLRPQLMSYVKQYGIRHKPKYTKTYSSSVLNFKKTACKIFINFYKKLSKNKEILLSSHCIIQFHRQFHSISN